jgi:nicotinate-nucleotide pyrophosphorylase (carboxylating)
MSAVPGGPACLSTLTAQEQQAAYELIRLGLREDLGESGDLTSRTLIPPELRGTVRIVARQEGILAGLPIAAAVFAEVDAGINLRVLRHDGDPVQPGCAAAEIEGPVASLLTGERTALNFLTHLSGVATLTRKFVDAVKGTGAKILDTRKTLPGYRLLQKYAVRCGGGVNHRMGLYDAVLIKDNHLAAWAGGEGRSIGEAVQCARERAPAGTVIVEVDTLGQLRDALTVAPDIVLLDNMRPDQLREAVGLRDDLSSMTQLEASGGVRLETIRSIAEAGVERVSVGALTHSAPALDLGLDWTVRKPS